MSLIQAAEPPNEPVLLGCDFSSSPTTKKQIVLAKGRLIGGVVQLQEIKRFTTLADWVAWLERESWVGGFDLPFGLPRAWVDEQGWPTEWSACTRLFAQTSKETLRQRFQAYCNARPAGQKFAHRATDGAAGSSPSMKWVNPPVAWMMHAGLPPLQALGAWFPAHQPQPTSPPQRVALEAYPGLLAREVLGRTSYKADDPARQDAARLLARKTLVDALEQGRTRLGLRLKLTVAQAGVLVADASGDALDAALCLLQTAWSYQRADAGWGFPSEVDALEGWIATA